MRQDEFLDSLPPLQQRLLQGGESIDAAIEKALSQNPWFTPAFVQHAIHSIAIEFLDRDKVSQWKARYPEHRNSEKKIGIVMAGNVPLVGFHDLISVLASGHSAVIKLSDKDPVLTRFFTDMWLEFYPALANRIFFTERLEGFDAVIATGSNNSSRYFEYYFRNVPHILRQNRNGVAVLNGDESPEELKLLADDIFLYFGLGCRNVSKLFVPEGYDFSAWNEAIKDWKSLADHNKYANNLEYNFAIYIINQVPHINLGHVIMKEDAAIASRIGCVHYQYYSAPSDVLQMLEEKRSEIQCVVCNNQLHGWEVVLPGQTQYPSLDQYADGIDTMTFLSTL